MRFTQCKNQRVSPRSPSNVPNISFRFVSSHRILWNGLAPDQAVRFLSAVGLPHELKDSPSMAINEQSLPGPGRCRVHKWSGSL